MGLPIGGSIVFPKNESLFLYFACSFSDYPYQLSSRNIENDVRWGDLEPGSIEIRNDTHAGNLELHLSNETDADSKDGLSLSKS